MPTTQEMGGVGLGTLAACYGIHGKRMFKQPMSVFSMAPLRPNSGVSPRLKPQQIVAATIMAYLTGKIIGQVSRLKSHIAFTRSLDNPSGFEQAIEHIYAKGPDGASGKKLGFSVGWDVPSQGGAQGGVVGEVLGMQGHEEVIRRKRKQEDEELGGFTSLPAPEPVADSQQANSTADFPRSANSSPSPSDSSFASTSSLPSSTPSASEPDSGAANSKSKWDEIRAANSRGVNPSSWDSIRQSHERTRVQAGANTAQSRDKSPTAIPAYGDSSRTEEQLKFDAMLEAERSNKHRD